MKRVIFFLIIFGAVLLTACGSGLDEKEARQVATQAALGTPPPPKYQTAAAIYLGLTLTPTPTRIPYGTPTMGLEQMGATMIANQQNLAATQNAQQLALEQQRIAAEQQAERAKMTQIAAQATSEAVNAIRTAQAQGTQAQATAQAQGTQAQSTAYAYATGTQQGLVFIQQTQSAYSMQTQQAARATEAVMPTHAWWTVTAVAIENRIKEGQAREVELAVRRQEMKNGFDAYGPWLLVIFIVLVTSEGFKKWLKVRVFKRDEAGKMPVVAMEKEGKTALLKLEQLATAGVTVDDKGKIEEMEPSDPEEQKKVTERAQIVEMISQIPPQHAKMATNTVNDMFGKRKSEAPTIRFGDRAMSPVLDEAEGIFMEEA